MVRFVHRVCRDRKEGGTQRKWVHSRHPGNAEPPGEEDNTRLLKQNGNVAKGRETAEAGTEPCARNGGDGVHIMSEADAEDEGGGVGRPRPQSLGRPSEGP